MARIQCLHCWEMWGLHVCVCEGVPVNFEINVPPNPFFIDPPFEPSQAELEAIVFEAERYLREAT